MFRQKETLTTSGMRIHLAASGSLTRVMCMPYGACLYMHACVLYMFSRHRVVFSENGAVHRGRHGLHVVINES